MASLATVTEVLRIRGIECGRMRADIPIAGSPERAEYRVVVESEDGQLYIVEQVARRLKERKREIAETLEVLAAAGLQELCLYLRDEQGRLLSDCGGGLWQVVPFTAGVELDRPRYVHDVWRARAMAELLLKIRRAAEAVPLPTEGRPFSLSDYIERLMRAISRHRPDLLARVAVMHAFVQENLYQIFPVLPLAFCHGDYHPLNIIWKERSIAALIDWEFMGFRPELYDAANMVGCMGVEDPECLWQEPVVEFLSILRSSGVGTGISVRYFLELVIALRFAWLSEWLRKEDEDMINMELDYFDVLNSNRKDLARLWGCEISDK